MGTKRTRPSIIPDIVLEHAAQHADSPEARNVARRNLAVSRYMQQKRAEAIEPQHGEDRVVYDSGHTSGAGEQVRREDSPDTGDEAVDTLYNDTGYWIDALYDKWQRRSYDGQGATLRIIAHFEKDFDNAYWDGAGIWVGDGYFFDPFWRARTVTLHEWTHALTEKTLGLVYARQPGALNEHISDAVAAAVEQWVLQQTANEADWYIGRELMGRRQGVALRVMADTFAAFDDPVIGKDPQYGHKTMAGYYRGSDDNYGVHINSAIPNMAFALAAKARGGMTIDTVLPPLMHVLLTRRVGQQASFQEFANAMRASAVDLFGVGDPTVTAIEEGWREVGITPGDSVPPETPAESPCQLSDSEVLALIHALKSQPGQVPGLFQSSTLMAFMQGLVVLSDADALAMARNPLVVEAAMQVAAMPEARRFMAVARVNARGRR